jgi:hypothetical protein
MLQTSCVKRLISLLRWPPVALTNVWSTRGCTDTAPAASVQNAVIDRHSAAIGTDADGLASHD